jgi:hypothetical protein
MAQGGWRGSPESLAALEANNFANLPRCARCKRPQYRSTGLCWFHAGKPGKPDKAQPPIVLATGGYDIRSQLQAMVADRSIAANARASAARTLAELDGLIGRHQPTPERNHTAPLPTLSRDDLVRELERLRASCAADRTRHTR